MGQARYFRPIAQTDRARPTGAFELAGGGSWFTHAEVLQRGCAPEIIHAVDLPADKLNILRQPRAAICGLSMDRMRLMGVLNVTPDSFSDGGQLDGVQSVVARATKMLAQGADILDFGGESTRPGAEPVDMAVEIKRTVPAIKTAFRANEAPVISIDTRKAEVAVAAIKAGVRLVNDVSALQYDPDMTAVVAMTPVAVCLMHASGDPKSMQDDPQYDNVLLDVYDYLASRVAYCEANGIARQRIIVDPGIGFGKTQAHNLALMRGLSLFHGLGCAVLLGVSRKRFIGTIGCEERADRRGPGSIALGLEAARQGVQILRVHDIPETRQALLLWQASR